MKPGVSVDTVGGTEQDDNIRKLAISVVRLVNRPSALNTMQDLLPQSQMVNKREHLDILLVI